MPQTMAETKQLPQPYAATNRNIRGSLSTAKSILILDGDLSCAKKGVVLAGVRALWGPNFLTPMVNLPF
jgi:hypothetical protein